MILVLFIFGLFIGSFLNVLADRLPRGEDVIKGRSHCEFCKHKLTWYELIPLLSYIFQKGKSRCCHRKLSLQYPLSELATGVGFVIIYYLSSEFRVASSELVTITPFSIFHTLFSIVLFSCFFVIFIADLKYEIIPMEMVIIGFITAFCQLFISPHLPITLLTHLISAFGAGLFFFCLWFFSKGKAMGDGDIYVAALIGFFLGFPHIIVALYGAFLTGALAGIILILGKKTTLKSHIPFGPFLSIGCGIAVLWGETIFRLWRFI